MYYAILTIAFSNMTARVADDPLRDRMIPHDQIARRLGYEDWSSVVRMTP